LKQSKFRKAEQLFLLEGARLCEEAFRSDLVIQAVIIHKDFDKIQIPENLTLFEANKTQLEQIADSRHPQGIICVAEIPEITPFPRPEESDLILALDRIADPGNMGTIFRSALWFGVQHLVLGPGCVDPFSPKVVRSSMGAIGHLTIHQSSDLLQSSTEWQKEGGQLAALHIEGSPIEGMSLQEAGWCLIVGSEAHGVDAALLKKCQTFSIRRRGKGESLNAAMASAIALYALRSGQGTQ
jgi:TrmH family RNA methyltransferase